jgi:hypothetical protein
MVENSVRALRVTPRGVITDVWLPADTREQLTAMYQHLSCSLVELVRLGEELTMWCDEEGFLAARPKANLCAIGIAARHGSTGRPFVGTVLFTGGRSRVPWFGSWARSSRWVCDTTAST